VKVCTSLDEQTSVTQAARANVSDPHGHSVLQLGTVLAADLQSNIKFVQYLLETLLAALEEKMGVRSSKLGPDDDKRLDKLRKRRLTGNKGSSGSVNAIPTNVQDSPFHPSRANNGTFTSCCSWLVAHVLQCRSDVLVTFML
jgi:hypothetical protein